MYKVVVSLFFIDGFCSIFDFADNKITQPFMISGFRNEKFWISVID